MAHLYCIIFTSIVYCVSGEKKYVILDTKGEEKNIKTEGVEMITEIGDYAAEGQENEYRKKRKCDQTPGNSGTCRATIKRWTFEEGACRKFIYGGCGGNDNRFGKKTECEDVCGVKERSMSLDQEFEGLEQEITFKVDPQFSVSKNFLLGHLPYLYKEYNITFELFIDKFHERFESIIHFQNGGHRSPMAAFGDKIPAVWIHYDEKHNLYQPCVAFASINGNLTEKYLPLELRTEKWMKFKISQVLVGRKRYNFEVRVDGERYWTVGNLRPAVFKNVEIYAGDKWHQPVDGKIRNFKVETRKNYGNGMEMEMNITQYVK